MQNNVLEMDTKIQNFFRNKKVFITGGTGFLGKVFIEKLLRTTDVERIYVLARAKRGTTATDRMAQILKDPLFEKLHTVRSDPMKYIKTIEGDCTLPKLGISPEDRKELIEQVDVVFHCAATVRFNEPLSNATQINVAATRDMLDMAKEMKNLKSFVHVSSAFANCVVTDAEEKFYTEHLGITSDKLLDLKDKLGKIAFDAMEKELVGKYPNTYCYTKSVAEEAVQKVGNSIPICIFRPGIILATSEDPIPGWIDNLYGPNSIVYGCAYGVLRVMYARPNQNAAYVPVDYCANMMMACAWETATTVIQNPPKEPRIYTLVPHKTNELDWGTFKHYAVEHGFKMPLPNMIWYPILLFAETYIGYKLLTLIYHTLPGYLIDFVLLLMGKPTRMTKTYKKIHTQCSMLRYFLAFDFTFDMTNCYNLWDSMSAEDKKIYNFDMSKLDWSRYFYDDLKGMRRFIAKEDPKSIPQGMKMLRIFRTLNFIVHALFIGGMLWLTWSLLKYIFL
ncbi:fatty acyl-CoA reductase wat-like [Musca vetustissima]|uniref:fatty acyl-CoA reductase wat-like n=1 Tax=Musca vetustissima TaxID=27455 RepID=UPI002AB7CA3A|nr:fatty acyl-CoA reductase wat-like [Musca vetustissima]